MILTPIPAPLLPVALAAVEAELSGPARIAFTRIAASSPERATDALFDAHRLEALALARRFGMSAIPGAPSDGFHWDGRALRADSEPYVLLHELAHFQLAAPERRALPEFGLGPGPETGRREEAEAAQRVFGLEREAEEAAASLLGILWEAALGHPALASFLDQNWLEGWQRGAAAAHFSAVFDRLRAARLVDDEGRPLPPSAEPAPRRGEVNMYSEAAVIGGRLAAPAPGLEPT